MAIAASLIRPGRIGCRCLQYPKHLRVLERAGLIQRQRSGRVRQMKLEAEPLKQALQWIEEYRRFWEQSLDRLDDYLKKTTNNKT